MNTLCFVVVDIPRYQVITAWGLVVVVVGLVINARRFQGAYLAPWLAICCAISVVGHFVSVSVSSKWPASIATFSIIAIAALVSRHWARCAQRPPTDEKEHKT